MRTIYKRWISIDGDAPTKVSTFIRDNSAPDVEPLEREELARIVALKKGERLLLNFGAGGITEVRAIN